MPWPLASATSWSTSSRTPTRCRPRYSGACAASRRQAPMPATGRHSPCGRERCSWSAIPSRRSTGSAGPTSRPMSARARRSVPVPRTPCSPSPPTSVPARRSWNTSTRASRPSFPRRIGQPGFQALDPLRPPRDEGPSVAALDVAVADEYGKASAQELRDGEAEAVARDVRAPDRLRAGPRSRERRDAPVPGR